MVLGFPHLDVDGHSVCRVLQTKGQRDSSVLQLKVVCVMGRVLTVKE